MYIAYTMGSGPGDTDLLLAGVAAELMDRGHKVCGTAQYNTAPEGGGPCDMDVKILPDGPVLRISQSLGKGSRGCRLDPAALETAVGLTQAQMDRGASLLIVNKFGKQEAEGHGFREVIGEALSRDLPVIVGLNRLNLAAFQDFTGGLAEEVMPDKAALLAWVGRVVPPISACA